MKLLIPQSEFDALSGKDNVPCKCYNCDGTFYATKSNLKRAINTGQTYQAKYCSIKCMGEADRTRISLSCTTCNSVFTKLPKEIKKTKNNFCSRSCAATYNNTHKTHGTRRSKLEAWLEQQLPALYPSLEFHFNRKDAINAELDIYIPSLKLAFELNGLFHYEPIFGPEKLAQIQTNDERKFQACLENGIELCLIDVSTMNYFKPNKAIQYLKGIIAIIDKLYDGRVSSPLSLP